MRKGRWSAWAVAMLLAPLLALPGPGQAQPAAATPGGRPAGTGFVIQSGDEQEVSPATAYNPQAREYLVVWYNDRPGCDDIRARRLSSRGALAGSPFYIAAGCPAEQRYPDVAYNPGRNEYLVVWVEENGGMSYIRARRVSAAGVLLGSLITVVGGPIGMLDSASPAVAFGSTPDRYLVVWEYEVEITPGSVTTSILGQMVTGTGGLEGNAITVASDPGGQPRRQPDVAYSPNVNGYLVAWQQWNPGLGLWAVSSAVVPGGGGAPPGAFWLSDLGDSSTAPAVAALPGAPAANRFLVAWQIDGADQDVAWHLVAGDGSPGGGAGRFHQGDGVDQSAPAVAADEPAVRYLIVWRQAWGLLDVPVHGRGVSAAGELLAGEAEFPAPAAANPAAAAGSFGTFLVAWQDQALGATDTDVMGQFWGNWAYLPRLTRGQ